MNKSSSATIKVNIPDGILRNSEQEASRIGISVQDFIRLLLATYFSRSESIQAISRDAILLKGAQQEIGAGQYSELGNANDLQEHLLSL